MTKFTEANVFYKPTVCTKLERHISSPDTWALARLHVSLHLQGEQLLMPPKCKLSCLASLKESLPNSKQPLKATKQVCNH